MKHRKRLEILEEKADMIPDPLDEELALWMEQKPPVHISINSNSYDDWVKTIPSHLNDSFIKWSENIRECVQYLAEHIHSHRYSQKPQTNLPRSDNHGINLETETISASKTAIDDFGIFAI